MRWGKTRRSRQRVTYHHDPDTVDVLAAVAAIEADDWDSVVVGDNVVDMAQAIADAVVPGTTVALLSTSTPTVIDENGDTPLHGGSEVVFRVTKGTAQGDTVEFLIMVATGL